jgi:peptidoglycan/LPS O-acetylase OafA/YrhL
VQFIGWLGDSCPGVFILLSGYGLTWSYLNKKNGLSITSFYTKRALRIYPTYIVIHFIILAGALFIPTLDISLASTRKFLSLLGLRFTPGLFFYIVPAWWFVWLIIQLYVLFPFLIKMMLKQGVARFFILTVGFTIISRLCGILYSDHMYFWMMGLFFGTRLAEFTLGMSLAFMMSQGRMRLETVRMSIVLPISAGIYTLGFDW